MRVGCSRDNFPNVVHLEKHWISCFLLPNKKKKKEVSICADDQATLKSINAMCLNDLGYLWNRSWATDTNDFELSGVASRTHSFLRLSAMGHRQTNNRFVVHLGLLVKLFPFISRFVRTVAIITWPLDRPEQAFCSSLGLASFFF